MHLKRYAFIILAPGYEPKAHTARIESNAFSTQVVCVSSPEQARTAALRLIDDGVQLIELCGGFDEQQARELAAQLPESVPLGHVQFSASERAKLKALSTEESESPASCRDRSRIEEEGASMNIENEGMPSHTGLFNTRYSRLAQNTIDYWMVSKGQSTHEDMLAALRGVEPFPDSTVQLYIHVPFCAQTCRFCAFSGGNSIDKQLAKDYAELLAWQLRDLTAQMAIAGHFISAVNIGGGSPNLLDDSIGIVLDAVRRLPGVTDATEVAVETALATTTKAFIDELIQHRATKLSFGIQTFDVRMSKFLRIPPNPQRRMQRVFEWIDGRIPVINADLITGLPGHTREIVLDDLQGLIDDPVVNSISTYLLTPGAAPSLLAGIRTGEMPPQPSHWEQAHMRLNSYTQLLRHGWIRRGTNTYVDPSAMSPTHLEMLRGNECIGTRNYQSFLLGIGSQAVSHLPGVRLENTVDVNAWMADAKNGRHSFHLPLCARTHQRDLALWVFPLRFEGLSKRDLDFMQAHDALSTQQLERFAALRDEGLILDSGERYELSILGEVFMGQLVRDLKDEGARAAIDDYISEGYALGEAIADGELMDANATNNRQIVDDSLIARKRRLPLAGDTQFAVSAQAEAASASSSGGG